jgi:hypothetical protein
MYTYIYILLIKISLLVNASGDILKTVFRAYVKNNT